MNLGLAKSLDRALGALVARPLGLCDALGEALRPPQPVEHIGRMLVVKFWGLGNWALLRPVIRDLRGRYPGAQLSLVTLAGNRDLVADLVSGPADELLLVRSSGLFHALRDLLRAVVHLRRDPPDLALDFEPFALAGALLARLSGSAQRIGFASRGSARRSLYTVTVPLRPDVHASRSFRDLAEAGGLAPAPYVAGALAPEAQGRAEALAHLPAGPFVVLHPGSGDNFPGRRWSEGGFAAVGRAALHHGRQVLVTGDRSEAALAQRVAHAVGPGARSVAGRLSLRGLVAVLAACDALVSNDTGPVHLASALDVPTVALFGPNTPRLYGPLAEGSVAFFRGLPCSPCLTAENHRSSRCRIFACMQAIPTGEVAGALGRMLSVRRGRSRTSSIETPVLGTPIA